MKNIFFLAFTFFYACTLLAQVPASEAENVAPALQFPDSVAPDNLPVNESFQDAGLPGYQFIQDHLDYFSIYHTQMDLMGRVPEEDMKQNAFIMAVLTWLAANHEGDFPQ